MKAIEWLDLDSINLVNPRKKSLWLLTIEKNARLCTARCECILHRLQLHWRKLT